MDTKGRIVAQEEADRGMAYSAVISLKEILEYLLQFPCMILEIKKMQANAFKARVDQVLKLLQETSNVTESRLRQLRAEIGGLAGTVADFIVTIESDTTMVSDIMGIMKRTYDTTNHRMDQMLEKPRVILEQVPQIMQEIDLTDEQMKRFLKDTCLDRIVEDLDHYVEVQASREMVRDLLQSSGDLKRNITAFCEVAKGATILCDDLEYLLDSLRNSADLRCSIEFETYISGVTSEIAGQVRNFLIDSPIALMMKQYLEEREVLFGNPTTSHTKKYPTGGMNPYKGSSIDEVRERFRWSEYSFNDIMVWGFKKIHFIREWIELTRCKT